MEGRSQESREKKRSAGKGEGGYGEKKDVGSGTWGE